MPAVCKICLVVFICLNSRWSDSSFPLNSIEKDLNRQLRLAANFLFHSGEAAAQWHLIDAVDLDLLV